MGAEFEYAIGVTVPSPRKPLVELEIGTGRFEVTGTLTATFVDRELFEAFLEGEEALRKLCEERALVVIRGALLRLIESKPR